MGVSLVQGQERALQLHLSHLRKAEAEVSIVTDLRGRTSIVNGSLIVKDFDLTDGQRVVVFGTKAIYPDGHEEWESVNSIWAEADELDAYYRSEHGEQL